MVWQSSAPGTASPNRARSRRSVSIHRPPGTSDDPTAGVSMYIGIGTILLIIIIIVLFQMMRGRRV